MNKLITMVVAGSSKLTGWKTYLAAVVLLTLAGLKYRQDSDLEGALTLVATALGLAGLGHKIDRNGGSDDPKTADVAGAEKAEADA